MRALNGKKAILFVSFGVASAMARHASLDACAETIRHAFPDYLVCQAYTSQFIRKRLRAEGVLIPSVEEALEELRQRGVDQVVLQPSHLTPGEEYTQKVWIPASDCRSFFAELQIGSPLFAEEQQDEELLRIILQSLDSRETEQVVLLGHGSPHQHNPIYERLQRMADDRNIPVHIGVLESSDWPGFREVLNRLQQRGAGAVLLAPLLLAGGVHVCRDMAGDEPDSWKSRLEAAGFSVRTDLHALGERAAIREQFVRRVRTLLT